MESKDNPNSHDGFTTKYRTAGMSMYSDLVTDGVEMDAPRATKIPLDFRDGFEGYASCGGGHCPTSKLKSRGRSKAQKSNIAGISKYARPEQRPRGHHNEYY